MGGIGPQTKSEQARFQFVATLQAEGIIRTDAVAQVFLHIPREVFVPVFYEQERRPGYPWSPRSRDSYQEEEAWLSAIYRDEPLVTLVDQYNNPLSSSSAPSVMAMMLEAAKVEQDMGILEIGTGSGFHTALLATLNHNPQRVHTIDVEETLVRLAEQRLHAQIGPVVTHVGDARLGFPADANHFPYDRIVATASSHEIPAAWYDQLALGGRLIIPLQGMLNKGGFLIVEKEADGSARGWFDPRFLHFIPLRATATIPVEDYMRPQSELLRLPVTQHVQLADDEVAATLFECWECHWRNQWHSPQVRLIKGAVSQGSSVGQRFVTLTDQRDTIIQLFLDTTKKRWVGNQRGGSDLWETILTAHAIWIEKGRPGIEAYAVKWNNEQRRFCLCGPCEVLL